MSILYATNENETAVIEIRYNKTVIVNDIRQEDFV